MHHRRRPAQKDGQGCRLPALFEELPGCQVPFFVAEMQPKCGVGQTLNLRCNFGCIQRFLPVFDRPDKRERLARHGQSLFCLEHAQKGSHTDPASHPQQRAAGQTTTCTESPMGAREGNQVAWLQARQRSGVVAQRFGRNADCLSVDDRRDRKRMGFVREGGCCLSNVEKDKLSRLCRKRAIQLDLQLCDPWLWSDSDQLASGWGSPTTIKPQPVKPGITAHSQNRHEVPVHLQQDRMQAAGQKGHAHQLV